MDGWMSDLNLSVVSVERERERPDQPSPGGRCCCDSGVKKLQLSKRQKQLKAETTEEGTEMSSMYRRVGQSPSPLPRPNQPEDQSSSSTSSNSSSSHRSTAAPLRPGIAIIIGALTTIFFLAFLLLLYAKHCRRSNFRNGGRLRRNSTQPRNSGVERSVVESLPLFRFGSLRGQKDGLECAVCLGLFDPDELLRLLPKCKHAFHIECVDTWLDAHSSCPLCRCRVTPEDILLLLSDQEIKPTAITMEEAEPQLEEDVILATEEEDKPRDFENAVTANGCGLMFAASRHSWAGEKSTSTQVLKQKNRWRKSIDDRLLLHTTSTSDDSKTRKDKLLLPEDSIARRFSHHVVLSSNFGSETRTDLRPSDLLLLRTDQIINAGGGGGRASYTSGFFGSGGRSVIAITRCHSEIIGRSRSSTDEFGGARRRLTEERFLRRWLSWLGNRTEELHITRLTHS